MLNEYWCASLVIMLNDTKSKELREIMEKISKAILEESWKYCEWDYTVNEALKKGENFVDIHNWDKEKEEKRLNEILKNSSVSYRWTDETLETCESCFQS